MIVSLKLQGLFGDKGKLTRQVGLKTIMNTSCYPRNLTRFLWDG